MTQALTFAGEPLTGTWPEACPVCGGPLEWAQVPQGTEPYLVCVTDTCPLTKAIVDDTPTFTEYRRWTNPKGEDTDA